jgi:septum formation protein
MFSRRIVLGSGSPRRRELLQQAELHFRVLVSDVSEDFDADLNPEEVPEMLAERKARAIIHQFNIQDEWVLTADTIVLLGKEIIGKPMDAADAIQMIRKLSGKKHTVITGVNLIKNDKKLSFRDYTDVYFNDLTTSEIAYYVSKYKPFDKAGAYAIQEWIGLVGVRRIDGCFYNVMGLPVPRLFREMKQLDWDF